ncbi:hypothetical protein pkur_cds_353 [Pandoravirus kuranda]|uniref:Uncharacterized protein n=2 Tax=Pandoravirus TaxID=2060084 RepID=A0AA95EEH8_9VIRU|nr:hypothetical protein pneo_cds_390 [Pandoravirus neocaledonia]AVK75997.1 hypothetical protein pneo_cds_390 [Pandoravirus neocaledonia]WBR14528.1 hypothetical protein pkur_cds_353 [Pandoravirus kuranda]
MSSSYQCITSGACAYDKANDVKGTAVATFEPQQIISADEHRAQAGRRWLRLKTQGHYSYTPWADVEGRPYWALADNIKVKATTNNAPGGQADALLCGEKGCSHAANDKCTRCGKFLCLVHKTRYSTPGALMSPGVRAPDQWSTCCEACLYRHKQRTRLCWWLTGMVLLAAAIAVLVYLLITGRIG